MKNQSQSVQEEIGSMDKSEKVKVVVEGLRVKACAAGTLKGLSDHYDRQSLKAYKDLERIGSSIRASTGLSPEVSDEVKGTLKELSKNLDLISALSDEVSRLFRSTYRGSEDSSIWKFKKDSSTEVESSHKFGTLPISNEAKQALLAWDGMGVLCTTRKEAASTAATRFEVGAIVEIKSDSMRAMIADKSFEIVALQGSSKKVASQEYILKGSATGTKYPAAKHSEYRLK